MIENSKYFFSFNEKYDNEVGNFRKIFPGAAERSAAPRIGRFIE